MKSISNASILTKSLVSPILATVMIVAIAAVFTGAYLEVREETGKQAHISALRVDLQDVVLGLSTAHLETLKATSWKQSQVQDELIAKGIGSARGTLDQVQAQLTTLAAGEAGSEQAEVAKVTELFAAYRQAAEQTLDTIPADAFMAVMFLNDTELRQGELVKATQALLDKVVRQDTAVAEAVKSSLNVTLIAVLASAGIGAVLSVGVAILLGRAIARPTLALTESMSRLSEGDTDAEITGGDRGDEIGRMARTVQVFKDNMVRNVELSRQAAEEQSERTARAERLERLTAGFDAKVRNLLEVLATAASDMNSTSATLTDAAGATNSQAVSMAATAKQMSGNVQTVAAAAEELGHSISEISQQVQRQSGMARSASDAAEGSRQQVRELSQQTERIGEVVKLITDIAEQTNLLALNATIEAARAGDAGKGFAVVASEVKSLATQTARATEEIASQIQAVQSQTSSTVQAIESIVGLIHEMTEISASVASAVEEQNSATQEIGRSAHQAAQGTEEVTGGIEAMTRAASSTGSASGEVAAAAGKLSENTGTLNQLVDGFLSDVKAA